MRLTSSELSAFHAGDERFFRRAVEECSPRILAWLRSFSRDADHANDLLQEVWSRAYAKRRSFEGRGSLLGWLLALSRSVCVSQGRARGAAQRAESATEQRAQPETPDVATERARLQRQVRSAVMELPTRQREVVVLRFLEGLSTRETARELGCAEGTVKASLHQALKKLEASMETLVT